MSAAAGYFPDSVSAPRPLGHLPDDGRNTEIGGVRVSRFVSSMVECKEFVVREKQDRTCCRIVQSEVDSDIRVAAR